ncbi:10662_t:CDS:1 [Funneliformis geosporum]|uniref:17383_t:CDS:1 n=1 Tax=Funneliformis geosporum TaxID=1117311 RepID=A0A9W4WTM3_9GLOM|nr:17383_t:CDS:1 [Funneliformis geosporum]CAI2181446.1 10662_t:CDS:1 [Funneliformis geosporum]
MEQYHHYIPRFLLRNFAIDKYERIFESNINQQKRKGQKKNKGPNKQKKKRQRKAELLQTYDREKDQLGVSLISKTYGNPNMYKDINNEDAMHVEEKLSKLEKRASETIRNIVKTSQMENQVVLFRRDLEDLRKFIFIMNYRNGQRCFQYTNDIFDRPTKSMVKAFMHQHNLQRPAEVWLQNIREILDTPYSEVKDNQKIFYLDREDFKQRMIDSFLIIWQAGENDEFIITNNGFGIFEGVNGVVFGELPFQYAYHSFYVISPKLILVLCPSAFRKEVGTDHLYKHFGQRSIFDHVPHPAAIPKYVGKVKASCSKPNNEHSQLKYDGTDPFELQAHLLKMSLYDQGIEMQSNDTFTFPFVKLNSATVRLINFVLLNEVKPDLVLTFLSLPYLYKTIVKYHNDKFVVQQDFSNLKKKLFTTLNRTHKDDLHLRKDIPVGRTFSWKVREMNQIPDQY